MSAKNSNLFSKNLLKYEKRRNVLKKITKKIAFEGPGGGAGAEE